MELKGWKFAVYLIPYLTYIIFYIKISMVVRLGPDTLHEQEQAGKPHKNGP